MEQIEIYAASRLRREWEGLTQSTSIIVQQWSLRKGFLKRFNSSETILAETLSLDSSSVT